jgi:hypothetical protein
MDRLAAVRLDRVSLKHSAGIAETISRHSCQAFGQETLRIGYCPALAFLLDCIPCNLKYGLSNSPDAIYGG